MSELLETLQSRQQDLWIALIEHMQLSFISLFIAVLIAVPLGIFLMNHKKIAEPIIQITAIFQTIPSLAILGLLIPLVGIGSIPAIMALIVYALLPILRNTYTGLTGIDPSLNEAADAMGMNKSRKLIKVQLPLALPVIMAGIRTATVLIIGTATVAALIGAGGLGSLILLGIDRGNNYLIILGAVPAALLAILFDRLLSYLQHTSFKRTAIILGSAIVIIGGFLVVPLFNSDEDDLVIAGKIGAEPEILMNAYKLLIEQGTELSAEVEPNFGKTTFVFNALRSGEIDIYTEFTGTVLGNFFDIVPEPGVSKEAVYEEARDKLQDEYDMTLLDPMAFNNTYALAVTSDFAEKYDLKTISDLKPVQNEVNAGFTLEFNDREDGYPGIQKMYDLSFGEVITMEPQLRYEATEQGDVNVIDAYSTDSQIEVYDLVVLEDDMGLFPPYQGAPLMLTELIEEHPEVEDVLSVLDGAITSAQMREMNYQVDVEDRSAEEVAREFLTEEGFLEE
ncbi:MAG: ABC transporter permease/substrate-binding protein [Alkalibacterium sp.]|uniref:Osmoprotectant transport system permease protein n=1 Tax=Alkalibacterium gilvum TaxID=1130080 RepID=A0A1H6S7T8_9LACT|nr:MULTISPECIES: ABC transporter permease/substrate-binding protein [Alkalibacterium]MDN6294107.1 ABC transporter permease/substrate-binding protein [Alkalibacterium sp.]MDN6295697.1 ABC transporter permease/substrate-binding protein [Alkalibacterium sp.]MDN6327275.1 ABC transporter permease/substrate-binding protein [Alkalibacterium sp.]MDN6398277.1 ABC transporter permease/substrate-binding protein [Alkalibacterium sp.]SEI60100.1 osmoprotectant transport system permease protein [Alkalibacter